MKKLTHPACLALLGPAALDATAQQAGAAPQNDPAQDAAVSAKGSAAAGDGKLQQVTIAGSRADDIETRRLSTASKMIFGREERDRADHAGRAGQQRRQAPARPERAVKVQRPDQLRLAANNLLARLPGRAHLRRHRHRHAAVGREQCAYVHHREHQA